MEKTLQYVFVFAYSSNNLAQIWSFQILRPRVQEKKLHTVAPARVETLPKAKRASVVVPRIVKKARLEPVLNCTVT